MRISTVCIAGLLVAGVWGRIPGDLESAYRNLQQATTAKDAAQVKRLAAETCALARQVTALPRSEAAEGEKEVIEKEIAYAKDIEQFTEYALYSTAVQSPAPAMIDLLSALEGQNPKSRYLDEAYGAYLHALYNTGPGGPAKMIATAEKAIEHFPDNEDLLLVLADSAMSRKQSDRALRYAERLLTVMAAHPRPETVPKADWDRKRALSVPRAQWIAGMIHAERNQYYEAIKDLEATLPAIRGNEAMLAPALFHLGVSKYQLGRTALNKGQVLEGLKYTEECAAIKGPLSYQAWRNAQAMKAEVQRMR